MVADADRYHANLLQQY